MKTTYHNKRNPCPICESTSGKCRTTAEGLTLCMTSPDGAIAATGYRFIKPTANGLWGIYAPGDNRLSAAEIEERRRARDAKLQQEQGEHESGLGLADRDRAFRRLIEQLDLAPDHRENLRKRGLTDEAIARGLFRTVEPGQAIEVNAKLPGARHGRFTVSGRGILCPAFDRLGRIVGAQVRRDESENGRYRWLKADRSSHLQNGELPVTVAMPPGAPVAIAIIEGVLKPFVAANLHQYACIGAAGGLFNSSPEQFRVAVDYLSEKLGTTEIHFPVDAGGRVNEHVYKRDCETIRQLQQWGYRVKVGDWKQWDDKAAGDWDEIAPDTPVAWRDARDYLPSRIDSLKAMLAKLGGALRPKPQGFAPVRYGQNVPPSPRVKAYAPGDRLAVWEQAGKFVLDSSSTGSGKSYDAGRLEGKATYITADPRNVSTETLRNWTVLEGKHAGLTYSQTGRLVRVKPREPYAIEPNCARVETIDALRDKAIASADRASLICRTCPYFEPCKAGAVFGYLGARRDALQADRFVCHPSALPTLEQCDYSDRVLIWEEAASIFKPQRATVARASDLKDTIAALGLNAPAEFAKLQPWLAALHALATAAEQPRFGYSHDELLKRLPDLPSDLDLEAIEQAIAPDLDSALSPYTADGVDAEDLAELRQHEDKSVRKAARKLMKTAKDTETAKRVSETVLNQWLLPALAVLRGETGYLTLKYGRLTVTQRDPRLLDIARAAKKNIFLDATWNAEELAALLGVGVEAIAVLKAEQGEAATVRYVQVTGMGRLGMQRGNFQQQQAAAVLKALGNRHPDLATIDFKKHARDGDLRWFSESRGVNDAENASAIALVGAPCPNLESLRADFTLTYGRVPGGKDDEEFTAYADRRIDVEIEQGIGRLRANRRPGEELTVYLLGDRQPAFEVEQVTAAEVTPDAMSKRERFAAAVKDAIAQLEAAGQAVNASSVARLLENYGRRYVSRLWEWVEQTLIGDYKAKVPPPPVEPDTVEASAGVLAEIAKNDPGGLLEAALEVFLDWLKPPDWRSCLELLPDDAQQAVLACLLAAEPGG